MVTDRRTLHFGKIAFYFVLKTAIALFASFAGAAAGFVGGSLTFGLIDPAAKPNWATYFVVFLLTPACAIAAGGLAFILLRRTIRIKHRTN